ncbi:TRAF-type zinc finger domain-containing protein 1 isoform X2 [Hyperolius riggenbachi]|uniref:TRAF-type zinc finger domain-containing protein 1 isoform X2 n=1 Tax=Hyperolius riggenbachi TaxID=752182 RepID=UPI0035A39D9F
MASSSEQETSLCGNCKRDIPIDNFTIHEIHCRRNISMCKKCKEPFPTSDMEEHMATEHAQVTCKCKMTMEKCLLEEHEHSSCPLRMIQCQFCELELAFNKFEEHEEYCGARTESCDKCGSSVMKKDLKDHPLVCGKVKEPKKPARAPSLMEADYEGAWFDNFAHRNSLPNYLMSQMPKHVPSRFYGSSILTRPLRTSSEEMERNRRRELEVERSNSDEYENLQADLAQLSEDDGPGSFGSVNYQPRTSQNNTRARPEPRIPNTRRDPNFWKDMYTTDPKKKTFHQKNAVGHLNDDRSPQQNSPVASFEETQLPCEICEELFPADDLILHQSGCRLPAETHNRGSSASPPSPVLDFTDDSRSASPPVHGSQRVLLPCEFCGVQLEIEVLFHHQAQCEGFPNALPASLLDSDPEPRGEMDFPAAAQPRQSHRTGNY